MVRVKTYRKVSELISDLKESLNDEDYSVERIREVIRGLESEGKVILKEPKIEGSFVNLLARNPLSALQLWFGLAAIAISIVSIYFVPGTGIFSLVRIISGGSVTFVVLGYALVGIMFPQRTELSFIQRIGFGVMVSLVVVPILWVGTTMVNSTTQNASVVLAMGGLGTLLLLASTYRQFSVRKSGGSK